MKITIISQHWHHKFSSAIFGGGSFDVTRLTEISFVLSTTFWSNMTSRRYIDLFDQMIFIFNEIKWRYYSNRSCLILWRFETLLKTQRHSNRSCLILWRFETLAFWILKNWQTSTYTDSCESTHIIQFFKIQLFQVPQRGYLLCFLEPYYQAIKLEKHIYIDKCVICVYLHQRINWSYVNMATAITLAPNWRQNTSTMS